MKILIADDHELFLQGLEFILQKEYPEAKIFPQHSYTDIFAALQMQNDFDLIITDLAMPGAKWLDAIEKIHSLCSETPIIIISAVFDTEILQKTYDIGVAGYISKSFSNSIILGAINLVLAGGMYIPPELLQSSLKKNKHPVNEMLEDLNEASEKGRDVKQLTARQMEVLRCMEKGLSNKQIAYQLGVSEGTVKIHITLIMRALDVSNRVQAVREAARKGILKSGDAQ